MASVAYRSPTASLQAIPQATGLALPPTLDQNDPNSPPNPQRALNIAVQAISSGINQAISTVQNSGQMGGPPLSPGPAPALSPSGSPIAAFSGAQGASTAPQNASSGPNTGAIVGGEFACRSLALSMSARMLTIKLGKYYSTASVKNSSWSTERCHCTAIALDHMKQVR